jgi:hypothetical protein
MRTTSSKYIGNLKKTSTTKTSLLGTKLSQYLRERNTTTCHQLGTTRLKLRAEPR